MGGAREPSPREASAINAENDHYRRTHSGRTRLCHTNCGVYVREYEQRTGRSVAIIKYSGSNEVHYVDIE